MGVGSAHLRRLLSRQSLVEAAWDTIVDEDQMQLDCSQLEPQVVSSEMACGLFQKGQKDGRDERNKNGSRISKASAQTWDRTHEKNECKEGGNIRKL